MRGTVATWTIEGGETTLSCGPLGAALLLDETGVTLVPQKWFTKKTNGSLALAYTSASFRSDPLALAETYIRGGDFVATYAESGEGRVAPQLYWRATFLEQFGAAKVELIVSVRTDLLDSQPASMAHCLLNAEADLFHSASLDAGKFAALTAPTVFDASQSQSHLFVFRLPAHGFSFAQMVHPTDFVSAELEVAKLPRFSLISALFPERLEKGVIRRGRICGWFMPGENDLESAVALARQFVEEPLPLTT